MRFNQFDEICERYLIVKELNSSDGKYSYQAKDLVLDVPVILSVYSLELWDSFDDKLLYCLFNDTERHNIIGIKDSFDYEGQKITISTSFGEKLSERLAKGKFSEEEVETILKHISNALSYIHSEGAVYKALNPDSVVISNEGRAYLLGDAGLIDAAGIANSKFAAPELALEPADRAAETSISMIGPWTDVYSLALVWKTMLGKRIRVSAIEKGSSQIIGHRFFDTNGLLKFAGIENSSSEVLAEAIRNCWSEQWLEVSSRLNENQRRKINVYRIKRLIKAAAAVVLIVALAWGGISLYYKLNPVKQYERDKAAALEDRSSSEKLLVYADTYNIEAPTFYAGRDLVIEMIALQLGINKNDIESQGVEKGDKDMYAVSSSNGNNTEDILITESFVTKNGTKLEIKYDEQLERVTDVGIDTAEIKDYEAFLLKVLPELVPGVYLTEEEVQSADFGYFDTFYESVFIDTSKFLDTYSVSFGAVQTTARGELPQYAGNFDRGSKAHKEYLKFITKNGVLNDEGLYNLDKNAVKEYGLPCNCFRFDMKCEDFISELEQSGYELKLIEKEEIYTALVDEYSHIDTEFALSSKYTCADGTRIKIREDAVNGDLLSIYVYADLDAKSNENAQKLVAKALTIVNRGEGSSEEEWQKTAAKFYRESKAGSIWGRREYEASLYLFGADSSDISQIYVIISSKDESYTLGADISTYWPR